MHPLPLSALCLTTSHFPRLSTVRRVPQLFSSDGPTGIPPGCRQAIRRRAAVAGLPKRAARREVPPIIQKSIKFNTACSSREGESYREAAREPGASVIRQTLFEEVSRQIQVSR